MKKKKLINITINIIIGILGILLLYSIFNIIKWNIDSKKLSKQIDNINDIISIDDFDNKDAVIVSNSADDKDPYWSYIKMNLIDVNLNELRKTNSDTKGWIKVNGTNINYPFVQTSNNDYYLNRSFDKSLNKSGWVFMDYRNNLTNLDKNTILYAHGRVNKTMFGSLNDILKNDWIKNKDNYVIRMVTDKETSLWQIFSAYHLPTTNDYLKIDFTNDDEFLEFAKTLKNRSLFDFKTSITKDDKILTLSTCYNKNDKMVVHAKLIKYATKK